MSIGRFRLGILAAIVLTLARQPCAKSVLVYSTRTSARRQENLERRKQRALKADEHPRKTMSELGGARHMSLVFALLGCAFMLGVALSPSIDSKIFAATISVIGFGLMTLSLARVGHWEMVIVDIDRIDQLELRLRHGHIPANDR